MVDVTGKPATERMARAGGAIVMRPATLALVRSNGLKKGDVITVARTAGILGAKRTAELIPLCHPLPLTDVEIEVEPDDALPGLTVIATVRTTAPTGVEMEAITAVSVALVTVYDMAKGVDKTMVIGEIMMTEKSGGLGGAYRREG